VRVSPSPACALRFTSRDPGRPGSARFKLDALTVRPESAMEGFFSTDSHGGVVNLWASEVHHLYERSRTGQYGGGRERVGEGERRAQQWENHSQH